ncbi:MAG: hypothetical protein WCO58_01970 [bacterium]
MFDFNKNKNREKTFFSKFASGFSLVEVVIASSILLLVGLSLVGTLGQSTVLSLRALRATQGSFLLEEGGEAVKSIRDSSWSSFSALSTSTTYYLAFSTSTKAWSATTTNPGVVLGSFSRSFSVASVARDSNSDIVSSGGTIDTGTRQATITVSWPLGNGTTVTKTLVMYLSNIF